MRTPDQIVKDLTEARREAEKANEKVIRLETELKDMYEFVSKAIGSVA